MLCNQCGLPLLGTETFCPQCGARVARGPAAAEPSAGASPAGGIPLPTEPEVIEVSDVPPLSTVLAEVRESVRALESSPAPVPPQPAVAEQIEDDETAPRRSFSPLGLGMLSGCLVFVVLGLALLGVWQGLRVRDQNQRAEAARHYAQGATHLERGEYELAVAEFEWALRLRPGYAEAQLKLDEARGRISQQPTATPEGTATAPASLLTEGRAAYDRGAWEEAILKLEALQEAHPDYEQSTVRRLLVGAYTNLGVKLANEDRLEEAIRRFDQALALQPDSPDVQIQRRLAALYQSGLGAWEVNWAQAIRDFSAVYNLKPQYKDTAQRLQRAYVHAGDAAAARMNWCDAADYYRMALSMASTPELAAKRDAAARQCAAPTATATPTPAATVPSGTYVGVYGGQEDIRFRTNNWTKVYGRVVNAKGEPVPGTRVQLSAYNWSSVHTTGADGFYAFEFLNIETTYTVTLVDLPAQPVQAPARFGFASVANFTESR